MPDENQTELDKFLGDLKSDAPQLDEPKVEEPEVSEEEKPKANRRERRQVENESIRQQLQEEREARIRAEERAKALADLKTDGEFDTRIHQMLYGNAEPTAETKMVTQNLQKILEENQSAAVEKAYERLQNEREAATAEEREAESYIDSQLESLEDATGVDLTSDNAQARKLRSDFLDMVEKLSPKDTNGNITEYADFGSAFEVFQASKRTPTNPRAKEIASRSMERSSEPNMKQEENDKIRSYLRSVGIKV